jgi:hypothetical protein
MFAGVETQTSAAPCHVRAVDPLASGALNVRHVLSGFWPGGAVLSKAARPKSVAPVSLSIGVGTGPSIGVQKGPL